MAVGWVEWLKGAKELRSQTYPSEVAPKPVIPNFAVGRDLVTIRDLSPSEVEELFHLTNLVKTRPEDFRTALAGKHVAMFFEKPSLRTRITFEAGVCGLGGTVSFVD